MRKKITFILTVAILVGQCLQTSQAQNNKRKTPQSFKARYVPKDIPEVPAEEQICFALYTVQNNTLKLTAQLYPLPDEAPREVRLEIKKNRTWKQIAETKVIEDGWTAPFRVEDWDSSKTVDYRVAHGKTAYFAGTIKKDPGKKDVITVAAFTGNSVAKGHGGTLPKSDIVDNLKKVRPDLLFFSGDQVYNHTQHLKYWLQFGEDFGDIIAITPTVSIPDDHDAGQANLWGAAGKKSNHR